MTKIPDPKNYPGTPDLHPKMTERIQQVQDERFAENYPGGRPLNEILDTKKFPGLFDKV